MMRIILGAVTSLILAGTCRCVRAQDATEPSPREVVDVLRQLDSRVLVLGAARQPPMASMLARDVEARLRQANRADRLAWDQVASQADWRRFREPRLHALRESLGPFPQVLRRPLEELKLRTTGRRQGNGYVVENLVFQSRPGLVVAANLYRPARPGPSAPGIILCHSHQSTKHSTWRQDMGATWARAGCVVLVPDHLGHGERRQHAFGDEPPHDYHFRYDLGIQLHLAGESLMGWLVWDLLRGVDLLAEQSGVDARRIILISEPAGGGDVAAVAAALDSRIQGAMIQNFGGPEPETPYPLDKDADESFDYAGTGSWESTRNLRNSARDGFLPWMIVGSVAPRRVIYYHEFYWDRRHDPVWKRLQRIFAWEESSDALTGLAGHGFVVGSAPENSHWLPSSRELLYPVLDRWFQIPNPGREFSDRRPEHELHALTPEVAREFGALPVHELAGRIADERGAAARAERNRRTPAESLARLRTDWRRLLGDVDRVAPPTVLGTQTPSESQGEVTVERIALQSEPGIVIPLVLLTPTAPPNKHPPVVLALSQAGKETFFRERSAELAELLALGVAVCLPDVRGTGETSPGDGRDRRSAVTGISASEWMLGQSLLGGRLRDARTVVDYLRSRADLDAARLALWGDSFAPVNSPETDFQVPYTAARRPAQVEPLGGLLALLVALFDDDVRGVAVRNGLSDYRSILESPTCHVPHDVVVPGVLAVSDLPDVAAALAPRPLRLERLVDGRNLPLPESELAARYQMASDAYSRLGATPRLRLDSRPAKPKAWSDMLRRMLETTER